MDPMDTRNVCRLAALTLAAGGLPSAHADDVERPWSVALFGGDAFGVTGSLRDAGISTLDDLGGLDPALAGAAGSLTLDRLRYQDAFRRRHDLGAELAYHFSDKLEGFGRVSYEELTGRNLRIGELSSDALANAEGLDANFGDPDAWALELGARYYIPTGASWHPYAGAALGATRMDAITATVNVPDTAIDLQQVHFTRTATLFSQSLEAGVEYAPAENFAVRFSLDAEHLGTLPPSAADPALMQLGIDTTHDAESRWSFPLTLTASYRFG
jgi:opacity protein-like surface antigen